MNSRYLAKTVYGNTTVLGWTMNKSLGREIYKRVVHILMEENLS